MINKITKKSILNPRHTKSGGFTLLEVLVSTALLGIAVAVVLQLFSANLRSLSLSEDYVKASTMAEVKMREILDDAKLAEKAYTEMTDDGYRMDVMIAEVQKDRTMNIDVKLMEIDLVISWMKGTRDKSYILRAMKVIRKEI
jgi:prepilin-type N-terminal cleavage/methylation domain-containing protein